MSLGLSDFFTFGKYRGEKVADVLGHDAGYLCWLRDQKKASGQPRAFTVEANNAIDDAIRKSRTLKKKYSIWNATSTDLEAALKDRKIEDEARATEAEKVANAQRQVYEEWGAW